MSTYGDMVSRVNDELARSDLTTQVQGGIMRAIRYYERRRWWFNETSFTFSTVLGQEYYSDVEAGVRTISRLKTVDSATLLVNSVNRYPITQRSWDYINTISSTTTNYGQPEDFCLYGASGYGTVTASTAVASGQLLRLYPIPDSQPYTIQIAGLISLLDQEGLGTYIFPANGTEDVWSLDCEDLICCRAKWHVCSSYLKDVDAAQLAKGQEAEALSSLNRINIMRISSGRTAGSPF
jgi:hypothetical protein